MINSTVIVKIGRRVPKSWFRRQASKIGGLITFQENIWLIIRQALNMAKKKAQSVGTYLFVIKYETESENLNYSIEWMQVIIQGTREQEEAEYNDSMKMYQPLMKVFKKDEFHESDDSMKKRILSKLVETAEVDDAYDKGYGAMGNTEISTKLLEMGIITHIKWVEDYNERIVSVK